MANETTTTGLAERLQFEERMLLAERRNAAGFKTELARAAGCTPSYLSQVVSGKPELTPDQAVAIADFLRLGPTETEFFLILVDQSRAGTPRLKSYLQKKLESALDSRLRTESVIAKTNDPAYVASVVPANTYRGQTSDVSTAAVRNFLVSHDGVSEAVVYAMTKAIFANMAELQSAHAAAREIMPDLAAKSPIPLHPGAAKYYREAGLLK